MKTRRLLKFAMNAAIPGAADTDLDGFLDRFGREAPLLLRTGLLAGALLVELSPPLTIRRLRPASRLSERDLDAHVYGLATHSNYFVRQTTFAVKFIAGLAWGADAQVRSDLGVAPLKPDPGTRRRAAVDPADKSQSGLAQIIQLASRRAEHRRSR